MELAFLEQLPHAKLHWIRVLIIQVNKLLFSCSVVSNSLQPHEPQHARPPCLSPTLRVHLNPCPLSDAIQPSHPLPPSSPTLSLSQHQGLFQYTGSSHQVAKYWSFSFSISPYNEYSGLISFRMDWLILEVNIEGLECIKQDIAV